MLKLSDLSEIEDARRGQGRLYDLQNVLMICIMAVVAGADSYRAIARFMKTRFVWLQANTGVKWRRAPSHTGLRSILLGLDQKAVEKALRQHACAMQAGAEAGSSIAIDGKTLRGSIDRFAEKSALQWLSAFDTDEQLVIGQVALTGGDKDGEILVAQQLVRELGEFGVKGRLFTMDALHCQKKTLQTVVDSGNAVLVQLKGNQPTLQKAMVALAEQTAPVGRHHHDQIGQRNRIESRTTSVWPLKPEQVPDAWPHIRCLVSVKRHTEVFNTKIGVFEPRSEIAYYVSTKELTVLEGAHATRNHWGIENSLHYVRDVSMGEDASRIRHTPESFAQLRTWTLNLLRRAGHQSIKAARQILGWSPEEQLKLFNFS